MMQIWHSGRASHSAINPGGLETWGPSAVRIRGINRWANNAEQEVPHEMTLDEIKLV